MADEKVIRYLKLDNATGSSLSIGISVENGKQVSPIRVEAPSYIVITKVFEENTETDVISYILYYLRKDGEFLDFIQHETLEDAMKTVSHVIDKEQWLTCDFDLGVNWEFIPLNKIIPKTE
ncbi:MAG: hypothetical protein AAF512_03555 [Pseudomonadota bacterium]